MFEVFPVSGVSECVNEVHVSGGLCLGYHPELPILRKV